MRTVALREVVAVTGGGTPRRSNSSFYGGGIPWVTPKDMKQAVIVSSQVTLTEEGVSNSPAKLVPAGSVLIVVRSGVLKHTLPVALASTPVTLNQDMKALIPTERLDGRFLARLLRSRQQEILGWVRATTADNFPVDSLLDLKLSLPPIDEQRRIAAILDQADELRAKRRQLLVRLEELTEATFRGMFDELEVGGVSVGDLADVQGGLQVTAKRNGLPLTAPYLRVANVHRGRLDLTEVKEIRLTASEWQRTELKVDDLLFVEGHANPMEVGRVARWNGSIDRCTHQNHLIRARLDRDQCHPLYVEHWLNSARGAVHFRRAGKTTSGLNTISTSTVRSAPLLLPPLDLQREFATRVERINAQRAAAQRSLDKFDELFASLQARAFWSHSDWMVSPRPTATVKR